MENTKLNEWKQLVRDYMAYGPLNDKQRLYTSFKNRLTFLNNHEEYEKAIFWLSKTLGY